MPSPFPGMNPYLERPEIWNDFHSRFLPLAAKFIRLQVRPKYYVKINENIYIRDPISQERSAIGRPDLALLPVTEVWESTGGATTLAPASVGRLQVEEDEPSTYLEVIDRESREVVTAIELLSPANKDSENRRQQYLAKVTQLMGGEVNFVEIDLLRGGARMPWERLPVCDYYAVVSRPRDRRRQPPHSDLWPWNLRDRLPQLPIPLREGEPEASLDLQAILHEVYDDAGYQDFAYSGPPTPRLKPADQAWADEILRSVK